MTMRKILSLAGDRGGVTAVEFAIISAPLTLMIMGGIDLAYQGYVTTAVQGTTYSAGRSASLENATASALENYVRTELGSIANGPNVVIEAASFENYSSVGKPERITTDVDSDGQYDKANGDCFIDDNASGGYDASSQGAQGLGSAEDVVRYRVRLTYPRLTPLAARIGMADPVLIERTTFIRNEPYAGTIPPKTLCGV